MSDERAINLDDDEQPCSDCPMAARVGRLEAMVEMLGHGVHEMAIVIDDITPKRKLSGTWTSHIKPSLWHWDSTLGYFKLKWYHYLLPPWFPPKNGASPSQ